MNLPAKIKKLDEVVVNRIAAGEIIQRPANALKELIENSLDAKATNIQIIVKEGGLKLLQIQDNGTGIKKDDMDIVCERFTTSKLQNFEDLKTISTFGFRGEALASISHVALLTITTKTSDEKCAYRAMYINSKLKEQPKPCAGNQGTTITIENLFYNVATRRKALSNLSEEFGKITDVVMKYAIHNSTVGFTLKKHGETTPQVRTTHNSTKMNNIRILYGNPVARELLEIEFQDDSYQFKMHALITNPNYTSKRMIFLLFINNRLVESTPIKKMLEEMYAIHLPKKTHPFVYLSLEINPNNVDVNVHPTKHEVRFLHEDIIIEKVKLALDEKLTGDSASRTFYMQARLPKVDVTEKTLKEVLPEFDKNSGKQKKIYDKELIRTDSADQKLDKFNFTIHTAMKIGRDNNLEQTEESNLQTENILKLNISNDTTNNAVANDISVNEKEVDISNKNALHEKHLQNNESVHLSAIMDQSTPSILSEPIASTSNNSGVSNNNINPNSSKKEQILLMSESESDDSGNEEQYGVNKFNESIAKNARKRVCQYFGNKNIEDLEREQPPKNPITNIKKENNDNKIEQCTKDKVDCVSQLNVATKEDDKSVREFKSYSVNNFRREVKLTSVLKLRKEVEDNCHQGLREILSNLIFVGCIDEISSLVQSGVNLYICNTKKLAEELFYEIMLYDFANYGVMKFSDPISLYDLAMLGLETEEAGWTEEDGPKEELAISVKELLLEKADMMKEYFSIVIDKKGNLKSLPILLDKYFPFEGDLPIYILRLSTEVDWTTEQACFQNICRETARYYSEMNPIHNMHDWKYVTEHILYPAIRESLLPPKPFAHDSTILQIASLPNLYKVFERC
ncbi:DNA mismatch repair protein Mlh1 [Polistes fuscatus]|uniref:DNA mismatch repair protein Mlh1 n=1 Tax=Polistes fuscatus TaxID=30207 RepID=UPI001CA84BE4|nr:DNA mismatch repair protein Mlh1 [Polistes fuscatus]